MSDAAKWLQSFTETVLKDSEPDIHIQVRLKEMMLWEMLYDTERQIKVDNIHNPQKKPLKEDINILEHQSHIFHPISTLSRNTAISLLSIAQELFLEPILSSHDNIDQAEASSPGFMFRPRLEVEGYIVIAYRSFLPATAMDPWELRLLYHELAESLWPCLKEYIDQRAQEVREKRILLVALADAGILANDHALMLMRKHPLIAPYGMYCNSNNQVQVLTAGSPDPFTATSLMLFALPKKNYLSIQTDDYSFNHSDFNTLGYKCIKEKVETDEEKHSLEEGKLKKIFANQKKGITFSNEYISKGLFYVNDGLTLTYTEIRQRSAAAVAAVHAYYHEIQWSLETEDIHKCALELEQRLQQALEAKVRREKKFVEERKLPETYAWSISQNVRCSLSRNNSIVCTIENEDTTFQFASYTIIGRSDPSQERGGPSSQSVPERQQDNLVRLGFEDCLRDLIKLQPDLSLLLPQDKEETIELVISEWPYREKRVKALCHSHIDLLNLYNRKKSVFQKLLTSPMFENPQSCQEKTSPQDVTITNEMKEYYYSLSSALFLNQAGIEVEATFNVPLETRLLLSTLNEVLHQKLAKVNEGPFYDCTKPLTLWHSRNLCPTACHILGLGSQFCKRIYVVHNEGNQPITAKISVRGPGRYTSLFDPSLSELREKIQRITVDSVNLAIISLVIKRAGTIINYAVIFFEGSSYINFLNLIQPND